MSNDPSNSDCKCTCRDQVLDLEFKMHEKEKVIKELNRKIALYGRKLDQWHVQVENLKVEILGVLNIL
jgi:uncharacterized coiled-coil protein SlyX